MHGTPGFARRKSARLFGPGTIVSLTFFAVIVMLGSAQPRVDSTRIGSTHVPSHPLAKPAPGDLLNWKGLALTKRQVSQIKKYADDWKTERSSLLSAMSDYQPKRGRKDQIAASLEGYSQLSRTFDAARSSYWNAAVKVLTKKQKACLEGESQ